MIDFNGDSCYFVVPESKYGLSEIVPKYVTNKNFTFCVHYFVRFFTKSKYWIINHFLLYKICDRL